MALSTTSEPESASPRLSGKLPMANFDESDHPSTLTGSRRAPATFISSLSIPVQGANPIPRPTYDQTETNLDDTQVSNAEPRSSTSSTRAPRKSKTEAIAALLTRPTSDDDVFMDDPIILSDTIPVLSTPIAVSDSLDLSSVKTIPPSNDINQQTLPHLFGLDECPTFFPTEDEFADAAGYIQSIAEVGQRYGICKIVPPSGWKMPFVTDTTSFRFKTRLQRLNHIEAAARAKLNFLEQIYQFHKQQGNSRLSVPTINQKPLDLWLLRREVKKMGGYDSVTKNRTWGDVGRRMGFTGIPGLSTQLKNSYTRVILPFEHYSERVKSNPSLSPQSHRTQDPHLKTHQNIQTPTKASTRKSSPRETSPSSSPLTVASSPLSDLDDDEIAVNRIRSRRLSIGEAGDGQDNTPKARTGLSNHLSQTTDKPLHGEICEVCQKSNRGTEMLLCDGCDSGFHMFCLDPPLWHIPKGQWFCHTCLFGTGEDFGFDEGEEHSLSTFQARDRAFRSFWFQKYPPPDSSIVKDSEFDPVLEDHVEKEFWRLVQSPNETVEIEYGADVHSTTHGSAMPTLETHPDDPYAKDSWNLNNLPIASESLLRFIKSDISGMTVPWTYVGMLFSTFCWHNEDHYTYSINYMHWGETKTWYGIPGCDADMFEGAMRQEAPDLFEALPDLLFQLVTLMNPSRVRKAGVKVSVCHQRAGEFVITFPKAYHAGFNHGLNFNEAVNFALPDWLPFDRECVLRYQEHNKQPVFSHDELLLTVTQYSQSIKTALWLQPSLKEMIDRELSQRQMLRQRFPSLIEIAEGFERTDDQSQCYKCNAFCFLSQTICKCRSNVTCYDDLDQLCDCQPQTLTLRLRFTDTELRDLYGKVEDRAVLPTTWQQKLQKALSDSDKPPLRALRALVAEGERISYNLPNLSNLKKCVAMANEWVDLANSIIARKQHRKRGRRPKGMELAEDVLERPEKRLSDVYSILEEVDSLGFESSEVAALRTVVYQAEEFKVRATIAINAFMSSDDKASHVQECDNIIAQGGNLNIFLEELFDLERLVLQHKLLQDITDIDDGAITLDEVRVLLARARACELPKDNQHILLLQKRQDAGDDWEQKAAMVLTQPYKTIEELDEFENPESTIPIDPNVLDRLRAARMKAIEFERQANAWLHPEPGAVLPKVHEVLRLVHRSEREFNISVIRELRRTADFAADLEQRCESVLNHRYRHRGEADVFETMRGWDKYVKEHLNKFQLPNFERLNDQLESHDQWMERLPWYCAQHKDAHSQQVYDDVIATTRIEDDMPPNDEYFTCICDVPVKPPVPGEVSDAVQCDHCYARFHGVCARRGGSCPFCDHHHWNGSLHKERDYHFCYMPAILLGAPDLTKNYSPAWKQLETIVSRTDRLAQVIQAFLIYASQPGNQRPELLPQVRHYMRKLYRLGFAVAPTPTVAFGLDLAGLHRILANQPPPDRRKAKRKKPKFLFGQDLDDNWQDGTRCICRGRTSYLLNYPRVQCEHCMRYYHTACVFYDNGRASAATFQCPICCLRKNRNYAFAEVRVKYIQDREPSQYVDVKACLDAFSSQLLRIQLSPPSGNTVFVDLLKFQGGSMGVVDGESPVSPTLPDTSLSLREADHVSPRGPKHSASNRNAKHVSPDSSQRQTVQSPGFLEDTQPKTGPGRTSPSPANMSRSNHLSSSTTESTQQHQYPNRSSGTASLKTSKTTPVSQPSKGRHASKSGSDDREEHLRDEQYDDTRHRKSNSMEGVVEASNEPKAPPASTRKITLLVKGFGDRDHDSETDVQ